jgi:Raf kinase inhibitor-like YbhB/YbcL family protein
MQLSSNDFEDNQILDDKFTCRGENVSPQLSISEVPNETKSLCLIMHDPDAVGGDFTHWLIWNIDPKTTEIAVYSMPMGSMEGTNDFGRADWGGPCPPAGTGTHRYIFELYALDVGLDLPQTTNEEQLRTAIKDHVLDETKLTGLVAAS